MGWYWGEERVKGGFDRIIDPGFIIKWDWVGFFGDGLRIKEIGLGGLCIGLVWFLL